MVSQPETPESTALSMAQRVDKDTEVSKVDKVDWICSPLTAEISRQTVSSTSK